MLVCTPAEFLAASFDERRKLVVAQIEATPELHNQDEWAARTDCGTVCCAAGWTVTLAGGVLLFRGSCVGATMVEFGGRETPIPTVASELLNLDPDEHEATFYEAGTAAQVRQALLKEQA